MSKRRWMGAVPLSVVLRRTIAAAVVDSSAVAAVEFALILPILVLMTLAAIDFSFYIGTRIELEQAVRAGGQYALEDPTDTATITSSVQGATDLASVSVSVGSLACVCPGGATTPCRGDANYTRCTGNIVPAAFLTISGTTTHDPLFFSYLPWFSANMTVQQNLTMRVR